MFYRLRKEYPEEDWVVLRLRADLVDRKRCAFSYCNAATKEIADSSIESRTTLAALAGMFSDHDGMPARSTLGIPDHYTTNPQAEILVLDRIEPRDIVDVIIDAKERVKNLEALSALAREHNGDARFLHEKSLFDGRADYSFWR